MGDPEIKVEITSIEAIRPSSRTPKHLRIVKLSMLDQISPDLYVPLILFYPFIPSKTQLLQNPNERTQRLRETLAKALALHYPLAGRLRQNLFVECTDHGAVFVEAIATCPMSRVLRNPDSIELKSFVPARPESGLDSHGGSLLLVQVTIFECGGISLGLSFSHKIADASTIATFLTNWTKIEKETLEEPIFAGAWDIFPSILNPLTTEKYHADELPCRKSTTRRFVFTAEKVRALKRTVSIRYPTRVEAVSSLIWKCATKASLVSGSRALSSTWFTAMDMRKIVVPPFRVNMAGNLLTGFSATKREEEEEEESDDDTDHLQVFAEKLRNGIEEAREKYTKKERVWKSVMGVLLEMEREVNRGEFYSCASWCGFGLYGLDFGWGNPVWVSVVCSEESENLVVLMDGRDGVGIEAWLVFREDHMNLIQSDQELLAFASLNPCAV